ncbi:MAG: hypothetical protein IJ572_00070 [Bacilli bacterium]|nr:hypothetical protein [Bacilli bacterium]
MSFEDILFNVIFFLVLFLVVFLVDFFIISKDKKGKNKIDKITSIGNYLISRFNLDDKNINLKILNFHISIINAFIISFVSTTVCITNLNIGISLLISFVLLFALIYSIYEIYGRFLKKKYGKINKKVGK